MRCRKTKFPTVYPTIYLPKWNFEYSYPLNNTEWKENWNWQNIKVTVYSTYEIKTNQKRAETKLWLVVKKQKTVNWVWSYLLRQIEANIIDYS